MTGNQSFTARIALGCFAAAASLLLTRWRGLRVQPQERFDRSVYGLFAVTRLGLFSLTFLVLKIKPRGDVPAYYWDQARNVLAGLLPYRDFVSSYAPLHPYLDAGLISLWHTPLAIMLFSMIVELAILPLWLTAGREFLPEADLRLAALLYVASPLSIQFVTIDGQDNVIIATLLALTVLLLVRSRPFAAGAAFGASLAAIKFLALLYAPAFYLAVPKRWRMTAGALAVCGVVYGGFLAAGSPVLVPLTAEGDLWSAGDIPYVVEAIFGIKVLPRLSDTVLALALAAIFVLVARAASGAALTRQLDALATRRDALAIRMRTITYGMSALTLALLVLSKKSWPPYVMLALFPVCLVVASGSDTSSKARSQWKLIVFAIFSVVSVTEHSYWASSLAQFPSPAFHQALLAGQGSAFLMLLLELLLIAGYLWLLWEAVRRILILTKPEGAM